MLKIKTRDKYLNNILKCLKVLGVIVFCWIMALSVRDKIPGRELLNSKEVTSAVYIPNPIKTYQTLKEVRDAVGYDFMIPTVLPKGYKQDKLMTIGDKVVSISYTDIKNEIQYRTAEGKESISGDYKKYNVTEKAKIGDKEVYLSGDEKLIYLAEWTQGNQSFSITSESGIERSQMIEIIESLTLVCKY